MRFALTIYYKSYIFPPSSFPLTEMTPAPTQTIMNTISKSKVLSSAFVLDDSTLYTIN